MKRRAFLQTSAAAGLGLMGALPARAGASKPARGGRDGLRAGFAEVKITPPIGTTMMGFGSRDMTRGCEGVHDDIYVRAVCIAHGDVQVLLMGYDLCFLGQALSDRLKGALGRQLRLAPWQVLLNASHNHAGPSAGTWYSAGYEPADRLYLDDLERATLQAARVARDGLREVTMWVGTAHTDLPVSRRKPDGKGGMAFAPNADGVTYRRMPLCVFKDRAGRPVYLVFSVSAHPSILLGYKISAEYPGAAIRALNERLGLEGSVFLQGVGGDCNTLVGVGENGQWARGSWPEVDKAGHMVADAILSVVDDELRPVRPGLATAMIEMAWPLQPVPPRSEFESIVASTPAERPSQKVKRWWAARQMELLDRGMSLPTQAALTTHGIQLAEDVRMFAVTGEPVSAWGGIIEAFYGDGVTFPLGYSNGQGLYLPVSRMIPEGGYEVESYWEYGYPAGLATGMEQIVLDTLSEMRGLGIG